MRLFVLGVLAVCLRQCAIGLGVLLFVQGSALFVWGCLAICAGRSTLFVFCLGYVCYLCRVLRYLFRVLLFVSGSALFVEGFLLFVCGFPLICFLRNYMFRVIYRALKLSFQTYFGLRTSNSHMKASEQSLHPNQTIFRTQSTQVKAPGRGAKQSLPKSTMQSWTLILLKKQGSSHACFRCVGVCVGARACVRTCGRVLARARIKVMLACASVHVCVCVYGMVGAATQRRAFLRCEHVAGAMFLSLADQGGDVVWLLRQRGGL